MLKSKELVKGVIIEVEKESDLMALGVNGSIFAGNKVHPMKKGEQYEVLSCGKKSGTSFVVELKKLNSEFDVSGEIFLFFLSPGCKIVHKPESLNQDNFAENETSLNSNEEFILVNKNDPKLFYKSKFDPEHYTSDPKDHIENNFLFNSKIGQRKRLKNIQSLNGVLSTMSGIYRDNYDIYSSADVELQYRLHSMSNIPDWAADYGRVIITLEDIRNLELRKYNTDTRTVSDQAVEYDCVEVVKKMILGFNITKIFGEAVSKVVGDLIKDNKIEEKPYLFTSSYTKTYLEKLPYVASFPKEKDIYLDLAIKESKLKKKDIYSHNNNSFCCIAFSTKEELDSFCSKYKNKEKEIKTLHTSDVLNHPEIMKITNKSNKSKP